MSFDRIRLVCATVLILMTLVFAACAPPTTSTEASQSDNSEQEAEESTENEAGQEANGDPIRIGALFPLSAPGSVVGGEAMRAAMLIAADEINASGGLLGRPVELIVVDSEGLPERGAAVSERLGLVDVCLNNDFQVQITPDRRRAAQSRKENPIRLWCSPRPSASSADKKVFFATLRVTSRINWFCLFQHSR